MSSDWDFINEEMGGWDEDSGLPNFCNEPGFYEDEEQGLTILSFEDWFLREFGEEFE